MSDSANRRWRSVGPWGGPRFRTPKHKSWRFYKSYGMYDKAERLYISEYPDTASSLDNQAGFYNGQGKYIQQGRTVVQMGAGN
ncbi:hypothetical protein BC936DRAFT_149177 [Jimgerdemannia flammicorona]|uniref:Uncharacterized protein n=1 Tax=Jimgerdemannia flammicorona TaxID=994334 RepID=A0A433DKC5_9FUNG|nr:hypothetical protein BC936DRAFT_149177 [Jimgerdemannia flammicorona]